MPYVQVTPSEVIKTFTKINEDSKYHTNSMAFYQYLNKLDNWDKAKVLHQMNLIYGSLSFWISYLEGQLGKKKKKLTTDDVTYFWTTG